mgnify:CR=1 FL=1
MGNFIQDITLRYVEKFLGSEFFNSIEKKYKETRVARLKRELKTCGENISIQWPIEINTPHEVAFGNYVSLAAYVHIWGKGGVTIGNRVMIGSHTSITSLTHDYNQEIMFSSEVKGSVYIGDDVWIGSNCVILPNIRIDNGVVVGAGSVVTHNLEEFTIAAGVPARPIRKRDPDIFQRRR